MHRADRLAAKRRVHAFEHVDLACLSMTDVMIADRAAVPAYEAHARLEHLLDAVGFIDDVAAAESAQ